jgi:outer membrane lipoprotein-sorting protein
MRLRSGHLALITVLAVTLAGCGGSEPSESQMKDAMSNFLNHPPDGSTGDPINIATFKKGACDKPTAQGYNCTFTMTVTSANMLAQMFNNLPSAVFYKDPSSGNWMMRAPF